MRLATVGDLIFGKNLLDSSEDGCHTLPLVQNIDCLPFLDEEGCYKVDFRLVYRGPIPSQGSGDTRSKQKQQIRRYLHPQLKELWRQNETRWGDPKWASHRFNMCGFKFCPIICKDSRLVNCMIDVLFLRRDHPGNLIKSGGDIDNRIKVLFDALRKPQDCRELASDDVPSESEAPFFCLLEDDSLVTSVKITTDRLLIPQESDEKLHDVNMIISVSASFESPSMEDHDELAGRLVDANQTIEKLEDAMIRAAKTINSIEWKVGL